MRFGVHFRSVRDAAAWTASVREVERLGFATLLVGDHLSPTLAPFSALAAAAAVTERIRIGTLVLNNDLRHPAVLAHEAATLDLLSDGRLELGIGAGWSADEYRAAGLALDDPGRRIDRLMESISIVDGLLRGETVSVEGEHYTVRDHRLGHACAQQPRPPLIVGANGDRLLSLAARRADGVNLSGVSSRPDGTLDHSSFRLQRFASKIAVVGAAGESRHAPGPLEISVYVWHVLPAPSAEEAASALAAGELPLAAEDLLESPFVLLGTPEEMAEKLSAIRARFGVTYWIVDESATHDMALAMSALG